MGVDAPPRVFFSKTCLGIKATLGIYSRKQLPAGLERIPRGWPSETMVLREATDRAVAAGGSGPDSWNDGNKDDGSGSGGALVRAAAESSHRMRRQGLVESDAAVRVMQEPPRRARRRRTRRTAGRGRGKKAIDLETKIADFHPPQNNSVDAMVEGGRLRMNPWQHKNRA